MASIPEVSFEHLPTYTDGDANEVAELMRLAALVTSDVDDFQKWEPLVNSAQAAEGGLNRNSSPQAIAFCREVYDKFLYKFPLLFGYWKKYADLEFSIAGTEAAEMVYERGIASIISVDLWTAYCEFKVETSHDPEVIRELFEQGAEYVGIDFQAHPFWDKYIEFEKRFENFDNAFAIHARIIHIPLYQYARYYQVFREQAQGRPITDLATEQVLIQFRNEIVMQTAPRVLSEIEMEQAMRQRLATYHHDINQQTQGQVGDRWKFEGKIARPYFLVEPIEEAQLENWNTYLDFEESRGNYARIVCLYERCLVTCAHYVDFWKRYARWMIAQPDREEEVRNIFRRASFIYAPMADPSIRLLWARFEEMLGWPANSQDIHEIILMDLPNHAEMIKSLAGVHLRRAGFDAVALFYSAQLANPATNEETKGAVVAQWAMLVSTLKGVPDSGRQLFDGNKAALAHSREFWVGWLKFEIQQLPESQLMHYQYVKGVMEEARQVDGLDAKIFKELAEEYMEYLVTRGGDDSAQEYMAWDKMIHGPASIAGVPAPVAKVVPQVPQV